jgi:hypothetical protein
LHASPRAPAAPPDAPLASTGPLAPSPTRQQSPGYPHGDGDCPAPNCNCGKVPCGFYWWNHSSTTIVNGQSFLDWFKDTYIFDAQGTSPLVSGFYFDDCEARCRAFSAFEGIFLRGELASAHFFSPSSSPPPPPPDWPASGGFPDPFPNMTEDTGLTAADQAMIAASYTKNMAAVYDEVLARGMFSWQQMWNGQSSPDDKNGCCTRPLVEKGATCAPTLRRLCAADSPSQKRLMQYSFSPGGCQGDPSALQFPLQDIANFMLIRGDYAYLGHGWLGCSRTYEVPKEINFDYGVPTELCHETAPNSGVFTRDWTKATISLDCNTWTPTITMK